MTDPEPVRYKFGCGCVNRVEGPARLIHSIEKCAKHAALRRDPATLDEAYYTELGLLKDGKLAETKHVEELIEALGNIPVATLDFDVAVEIGCGTSPYTALLMESGYIVCAADKSNYAVDWMRRNYDVLAFNADFEVSCPIEDDAVALLFAMHFFEHLNDAPAAFQRAANLLIPRGELWLIVPDGSDPINPDHLFFFDEKSLKCSVEMAGLNVEHLAVRKYVERENFIYCRARKPG